MWRYVYSDELYHHGTKGMKWGRRLYQNKDGSLTPLGKVRYKTNDKFRGQVNKERALAKARATKAANKSVEEKRAELLKSTDAAEIYKNKHLLTTQELNDRINRIDTEARLQSKIATEKQKTGMEIVNDKMKSGKNTLDNAVGLYKSVDEAYKTVTGSAIGKALAKKLGIEPPKKDFDLNEVFKNIDKMSDDELAKASKRVENRNKVKYAWEKENETATKDAQAKAEQTKEAAQKQVDDYNERWANPTTYSKKGKDVVDSKMGTGNKNSNILLLEDKSSQSYVDRGKDIVDISDRVVWAELDDY